jgi:hypothetical protein
VTRSDSGTEKTAKQTTDIVLYDQKVVVFKMESDVMLYVVGSVDENEVLLYRYDMEDMEDMEDMKDMKTWKIWPHGRKLTFI